VASRPDVIDGIKDELADRFGAPPAPARHLLELRRIRLLGVSVKASEMKLDHARFEVWLRQPLTPRQAHTVLTRTKEDLEFLSGKEMGVRLKRAQGDPEAFLERATKLLQALGESVTLAAK
jgi:transcription-repair coupling factor (superfamily II helicase)